MDAVLRGTAVYLFLVFVFSVLGRRTLVQTTNFDLLLLIIIGQCTQLALLGDDFSVTNAVILVSTLLGLHLTLAAVSGRFPRIGTWIGGGAPLVVVANGQMLDGRARRVGVSEADVLLAARKMQGLDRIAQIQYAVVERTGDITVVPMPDDAG